MPLVRVLRPCASVCVCASLLLFFALIVFLLVLLLLLLLFLVCVCFFCELFSNCQSRRFFWVVAKIFPRYETLHGAWGGPRQGRPRSGSGLGSG